MKYKIHDIVFTRDDEAIIVTGTEYDYSVGGYVCSGVIPETGAVRYYNESECYDNVEDYEKELLTEVKKEVKNQKNRMEEVALILAEELKLNNKSDD